MFSGLLKLAAGAAAMLGPFCAGLAFQIVVPEVQAYFAAAGIGVGLAGLAGFAALEGMEERSFRQRYSRWER
ncbi:hypothetical protein [Bosea sp. TND4EK4]|uniref:hypothetical protein n=1 Tax=Bosea sp. TND4EK4 TaxID=1907408 RepID=UPI000954ED19|nr:hypothetical protein [Bosea sp. TND4EK4]SIP95349.1 hypothetical protein SAMN05880592_101310 [Bosea sp. TND4EK4]